MKKKSFWRVLCVVLAIALFVPQSMNVYAASVSASGKSAIAGGLIKGDTNAVVTPPIEPSNPYWVAIMQGNTNEADDCNAIYNGFTATNKHSLTLYGWTRYGSESCTTNNVRVSETDFRTSNIFDVVYYSGHGWIKNGYPIINYRVYDSSESGTFSEINVATALGVNGDNWAQNCVWGKNNRLSVLILAACKQLDSTVMKYYARVMRASNIRVIAGYHESGPGHPTDKQIAEKFFSVVNGEGVHSNSNGDSNSVMYSWKMANSGQPWAVLVYTENYNQYYRLPGFPGNTYSTPSSSAKVYRYASHLGEGNQEVGTASIGFPAEQTASLNMDASSLPLYIYVAENAKVNGAVNKLGITNRESIDPEDEDIPVDSVPTDMIIESILPRNKLSNVVLCQNSVVRCEVDPDDGYVFGTDLVVERAYKYYNTYNGVRISNAFIELGVDAEGISYILNSWKDITLGAETMASNSVQMGSAIDVSMAKINVANAGYTGFENADVSLIYMPDGDGRCKLHYALQSGNAILYVDAATGEVAQ